MGRISRQLFGISPEEVRFTRRGFAGGTPQMRRHLEEIGLSFLTGYHAAMESTSPQDLAWRLETVEVSRRGFAFEGAGMGLALLEVLMPLGRGRLRAFLDGPAAPHAYLVHVGIGWALARLPRPLAWTLPKLDPVLGWLAFDGFGFHHGYFRCAETLDEQAVPSRLTGYARRAFDQGVGRSLWFSQGGEPERIRSVVDAFARERRPDLWSGVGLAAAYAGGAGVATFEATFEARLETLFEAAAPWSHHASQGVVFAAKARQLAGNPTASTARACRVFCGLSVEAAAELADATRQDLPTDNGLPAFEVWRQRIRQPFLDLSISDRRSQDPLSIRRHHDGASSRSPFPTVPVAAAGRSAHRPPAHRGPLRLCAAAPDLGSRA